MSVWFLSAMAACVVVVVVGAALGSPFVISLGGLGECVAVYIAMRKGVFG